MVIFVANLKSNGKPTPRNSQLLEKDSKTEDNVKDVLVVHAILNSSKFLTPRATELTKRRDKEDNVGRFMLEDFFYR